MLLFLGFQVLSVLLILGNNVCQIFQVNLRQSLFPEPKGGELLYAEIGIKAILANWRKHLVHHTVLLSVPGQTCDQCRQAAAIFWVQKVSVFQDVTVGIPC